MVSVIIPVYNAALWLEKTFESVLQQKHLLEIIAVDDHSTDNSMQILRQYQEKYPQTVRVFSNPHKGSNTARNYGFEQSRGSYIQWLDSDDQLLPGKFENQLKTFDQNPEADIVYSGSYIHYYNDKGELIKVEKKSKKQYKDYLLELLKDNWASQESYLIKRQTAERLHKMQAWNPQTKVAQDREYFTMAALTGAKFVYSPGFYSIYNRWNSNQISAMNFAKRLEHQIKLEKKFRDIIRKGNYQHKSKYLACLNSHLLNACYYNPKLTIPYPFAPWNINLQIIHWKKYPFLPFIYSWQHLKYLWKKFISNLID